MNLKKIGGALTAISMIASMATYLPAAVSAAEADTIYSGELDYCENVSYALNVTQDTLTLSPTVADTTYEIPADVLAKVAYEFIGTSLEENYDEASEVAAEAVTIIIEGPAVINVDASGDLTASTDTKNIKADCRAVIKNGSTSDAVDPDKLAAISADSSATGEVAHDYQPNKTYHNHICKNCNDVNNEYTAHKFGKDDEGVTIDKTAGTHTCACGKVDTEYLTLVNGEYQPGEGYDNYKLIHGFDTNNHKCADCGAYDVVYHQGDKLEYKTDDTYHTVVCKKDGDTDCDYAQAKTKHTFAPYYNANGATKAVGANTAVKTGEHYCTVCGYVPKDSEGNYTGVHHVYNCKFVAYYDTEASKFAKKIVPADSASEQVVCACGAVKPGHGNTAMTDADVHNYVGANGMHLCICGDETDVHNYCYNYNGKGAYSVNGQTGFIKVTDNQGAVCACGNKNATETKYKHDTCLSIDNAAAIVDKSANKHYCTCGKVIMSGGKEAHDYTVKVENEKHMCSCGKVNENAHEYGASSSGTAYYYEVLYNTKTRKNELVKMLSGLQGEVNGKTVDYTDYKPLDEYGNVNSSGNVAYDGAKAIICECGKPQTHTCVFDDPAMCVDGVHYCTCGAKSEEHTFGEDGTAATCSVCGKYQDHECVRKSLNDCHCKICNVETHELVKYGTTGHKCVICGKTVEEHEYEVDTTAHKHVCKICGYEATEDNHPHTFGKEGAAKCICQDCGYSKHDADGYGSSDVETTTEQTHKCKDCREPVAHKYDPTTDRCVFSDECHAVKPGHVHAYDHNDEHNENKEVCRCGADVAHEYKILSGSQHKCTHKNGSTLCEDVKDHTFDTATKTFCTACGAVNFAENENGSDAIKKVIADHRIFTAEGNITNYTTKFIVDEAKAYADIKAYDYSVSTANTLVAKTSAEQVAFNALVKAYNDLLATKDNFKSGSSATIVVADAYNAMIETPASADRTIRGQVGEKVSLKVVPVSGYKFVGWYKEDPSANTSATSVSTLNPYEITIENGNTNYYPKFEKDKQVRIKLSAGMNYSAPISTGGSNETAVGAQVGFVLNEKITVSYTPGSSTNFLYFVDNNGKIYSGTKENDKYVQEFTANELLTEIRAETYTQSTSDVVYVTFKKTNAANSEILATAGLKANTNHKLNLENDKPADPLRIGMNFIGWAIEKENNDDVTRADLQMIKQVDATKNGVTAKTLTLVPIYENQTGFKPTITGGEFANLTADQIKNGFTYGEKVGITAPEKDAKTGKYFSGWYVNGVFYDATRTTYYTVKGNDKIEAKFENDEPAEEVSYLTIGSNTSYDTGVRVVNLSAKWKMLDIDCAEVLDSGYVFSFTGKEQGDLTLDKVDNTNVRKKVVGSTDMVGSSNYPLTLKSESTKNATVTAVAYLTIRDTNGVVTTIYSDNMVKAMP